MPPLTTAITIEILVPATNEHNCVENCSLPCKAADKALCPTEQRLFSSDQWTVTSVTLPPGGKLEEHTHLTHHLAVAVSDLHLKIKGHDRPEADSSSRVGEVAWINPATHTITNAGEKPARIITLEFSEKGEQAASHSQP